MDKEYAVRSVEWVGQGTDADDPDASDKTIIEVAGTIEPVGAGDTITYHRRERPLTGRSDEKEEQGANSYGENPHD